MEIRRLRYFMRIADDGSLTRSAAILRVAQSALTRQIRLLEEELGVKLFVRTYRGMVLTEEGEQFRLSIAAPLRELELAIGNIRSGKGHPVSTVVIGLPPGLSDVLAMSLAVDLEESIPHLAIKLIEGPTGSLVDWLNRGVIDLALLEDSPKDARIDDRILYESPLWVVGAKGSLSREGISFAEAVELPLIIPSHHLGLRAVIEDAAIARNLPLNIQMQVDASRIVRDLAAHGTGYGILPKTYCRDDLEKGRLDGCPILQPELNLPFHLAFRRHRLNLKGNLAKVEEAIAKIARTRLSA